MQQNLAIAALVLTIAANAALAAWVLRRNPAKRTHRVFAGLALNVALWASAGLGSLAVASEIAVKPWAVLRVAAFAFLPGTFYHLCCVYPGQRFRGNKLLLALLYAGGPIFGGLAWRMWPQMHVLFEAGRPVLIDYGPLPYLGLPWTGVAVLACITNLLRKLRPAAGLERYQASHLLISLAAGTVLATWCNLVMPMFEVHFLEIYGPVFTTIVLAAAAYAMLQYNLVDVRLLASRATLYTILTAAVIVLFFGTVSLTHWALSGMGSTRAVVQTILGAFVVVVVLLPLKEWLQLALDRRLLKKRYDMHQLVDRLTGYVSDHERAEDLLAAVVDDIRDTVGARGLRVFLADEEDPLRLAEGLPSDETPGPEAFEALFAHVRAHRGKVLLEQLLLERPTEARVQLAQSMAETDTFLCIPLRTSAQLVGLLAFRAKTSGDVYSGEELAVLGMAASALAGAIRDIRLRRRVYEANLHLGRILASMHGAVVSVNAEGVITTINESAKKILGEVAAGRPYQALLPDVARVFEWTLREQRGVSDYETVLALPGGGRVPVVISSSCLESAGEGAPGALVMMYDLSHVKQLEQHVHRADRLSSIGTLAAGMAHEIKNPLVSIKSFTQLLLKQYDDEDFRRTFAEVVPQEVDRIDTLVGRLLGFACPKPVAMGPQAARPIVQSVLSLVEGQLDRNQIETKLEIPEDLPLIHGDEQQLHQVVLNLVLNAIDALKEQGGGTLTVSAEPRRTALKGDALGPLHEWDCVALSIADTGRGIPEPDLEHLFTPFFTTKANGCGLGLAVVHGVVTELGGEIDVHSVEGSGTRITLVFRQAQERQETEAPG